MEKVVAELFGFIFTEAPLPIVRDGDCVVTKMVDGKVVFEIITPEQLYLTDEEFRAMRKLGH